MAILIIDIFVVFFSVKGHGDICRQRHLNTSMEIGVYKTKFEIGLRFPCMAGPELICELCHNQYHCILSETAVPHFSLV